MTAAIADDKFTKASLAAFVSAARSTLPAARCAAPDPCPPALGVPSQQSSRKSSSATHNHVPDVGQFEYIELGKLKVDDLGSDCCFPAISGGPQIGAGLLKNFIVIFDYPTGVSFLKGQTNRRMEASLQPQMAKRSPQRVVTIRFGYGTCPQTHWLRVSASAPLAMCRHPSSSITWVDRCLPTDPDPPYGAGTERLAVSILSNCM